MLACNEWLYNIKIKIYNIAHFVMIKTQYLTFSYTVIVICFLGKAGLNGGKPWLVFNKREESYIHESILFRFPGSSDDAFAINYRMLYAKYNIYFKKHKEEDKKENLM